MLGCMNVIQSIRRRFLVMLAGPALAVIVAGCTPALRAAIASGLAAAGPLVCEKGIGAIDNVPGWTVVACTEALDAASKVLSSSASGTRSMDRCVGVYSEGKQVAIACRKAAP